MQECKYVHRWFVRLEEGEDEDEDRVKEVSERDKYHSWIWQIILAAGIPHVDKQHERPR